MPDLDGGVILPWQPEMAWFPSDLRLAGRAVRGLLAPDPAAVDGRRPPSSGYTFNLGIETEFLPLREGEDGSLGRSSRRHARQALLRPADVLRAFPVVDEIVTMMNGLGWDVYSFDHEDGNGQFETDFAYTDALAMCRPLHASSG